MKAKNRKDFYVEPYDRKGEQLWAVRVSKHKLDIITICRNEAQANEYARILNIDPYIFEKADWKKFMEKRR